VRGEHRHRVAVTVQGAAMKRRHQQRSMAPVLFAIHADQTETDDLMS
jgi:hypothetical protein